MTGIRLGGLTTQDTIDDTALIPITNKDKVTRNISFSDFKLGLTKGGVSGQINLDPSTPITLLNISNDNIDFASISNGQMVLDVSKLPTNQALTSIKYVRDKSDLTGALSSSVVYIIDGSIDMGTTSITVPAGGLNLAGYSFDVSGLYSSADNYTMFVSPAGGSGNFLGQDYFVQVNGANSKVYDIVDSDFSHAFEFERINYSNCTSLGTIKNYRQGLEGGTGRFGGTPELTLAGNWLGGYRITTSIVRGLDNAMTGTLFKAGAGFQMASRFLTDINADLPPNCSLCDFAGSNFVLPSTVQIQGAIVTGAANVGPTPNLAAGELECDWRNNIGIDNTYVGGSTKVTTATLTPITAINTYYDVLGTFTASELQHFDAPASGQLRHLGTNPINYKVNLFFSVAGTAGNLISLKIVKWDDSASGFVDVVAQQKPVLNLTGGTDVAFFNVIKSVQLDQNDYIKIQVANNSGTADVTVQLESFYEITER